MVLIQEYYEFPSKATKVFSRCSLGFVLDCLDHTASASVLQPNKVQCVESPFCCFLGSTAR